MGLSLLNWLRSMKREWKTAFVSTFLFALLIHIYKFTNTLPNHDSLFNYYSDQNVLGSGRWLLSIACGFSSWFDLPWVTGLISVFFIALTVVIIVDIFEITNPVLICLCGGLLAAFPGITETFFFGFTADGYMIAMFLSALSVRFVQVENIGIRSCILSGACICCSCGIYQGYVAFGLVLALFDLVLIILEDRCSPEKLRKWILAQVLIYISALASYYMIWKGIMWLDGSSANDYQGISTLSLSLRTILQGIPKTIKTMILLLLEWNVLEHHWTLYGVLNMIFLIFFAIGLLAAIRKTGTCRQYGRSLLLLLCLAAVPFAACVWFFVSPEVSYRPMMLVSIALVYIFSAVLYERYAQRNAKNLMALLLSVIIFNNSLVANISYYFMNRMYFATYATASEMVSRIHSLDTDAREIAVVGNVIYEVALDDIEESTQIKLMANMLEKNLIYDDVHLLMFINETFYCDYRLADTEALQSGAIAEAAERMDCWPASSSVQIVDDVIVIKLAEPVITE